MASEIQLRGFISSNLGDSDFEPLKLKSFETGPDTDRHFKKVFQK